MGRENSGFMGRFNLGIEEIILLGIIILNVFDVLEMLSPEWDYVKKIVSWTALGMVLYKSQLSKLFSGIKKSLIDGLLLTGFFTLIVKDLVSYSKTAFESSTGSFLQSFFSVIITNSTTINVFSIYIGVFILLFASIRLSFIKSNDSSSIFKILRIEQKENQKVSFPIFLKRIVIIFLVVLAFFLIVFNLLVQWLAIAIDAPLLMIGIIFYLVIVFKKHKKISASSFLFRFGNFGNVFYKKFINHLKDPRDALRILSGILVLHLITDALTFLMPLLFGIGDALYLSLIPHSYPSIWFMLSSQLYLFSSQGILVLGEIFLSYLLSVFALLVLLGGPVLLMIGLYTHKSFRLPKFVVALSLSSLVPLLGLGLVSISSLKNQGVFGVDFYLNTLQNTSLLLPILIMFGVLFFSFIIVLSIKKLRVYIDSFFVFVLQLWFVIYMGMYAYSVLSYFVNSIDSLFSSKMWLLLLFFILTGFITFLFYLVGTIFFVEDTHTHTHSIIKEFTPRKRRTSLLKKE